MGEGNGSVVRAVVEQHGASRESLMDVLRGVQARIGCITEDTIGQVAEAMGLHRVEVRDMASFYAFLTPEQQGRVVIRVCDAVVERMYGAEAVGKAFEEALGIRFGETTPDGCISLAHTACMGMSDQAPSALINTQPITRLSPLDVPGIVEALKNGTRPEDLRQPGVAANLREPGAVVFAPMSRGAAIRNAVNQSPEDVIEVITQSRLRGRGGAGFPTAMKWSFCRKAKGEARYIVCNADEGEPGTFKDRVVLTEAPDIVFEGMTIAAYAIGAREGFFYLRGEYEFVAPYLEQVLERRRRLGVLGKHICGREDFNFDIRIQLGAGAYICGEESALIESLEGKRGAPRDRPPFPVQRGFRNQPTVVNNVETFACAARVLEKGPEFFRNIGSQESTGTKLLSVSGDCEFPGVYEVPYGLTVDELLDKVGGADAQAVQVGGPSGHLVAVKDYGRTISFEDLPTGGSIIVFGPQRDLLQCMHGFLEFFVEESCGWCAPCRVGTTLLLKQFDKVLSPTCSRTDLEQLKAMAETVKGMSRCGLGQTAGNPILTSMSNLPQLYEERIQSEEYVPPFDLEKALETGRKVTGRQPQLEEEHV